MKRDRMFTKAMLVLLLLVIVFLIVLLIMFCFVPWLKQDTATAFLFSAATSSGETMAPVIPK